jgi:hypothetical protein
MSVRHVVPSVSCVLLGMDPSCWRPAAAAGSRVRRRPLEVQAHRAAVHRGAGRPRPRSGSGAQSWGFWNQDPGPRAASWTTTLN